MIIELSHPKKILYPQDSITKLQVAEYYMSIQDWIMIYLKNRPVSLVRCPQGIDHFSFFQKHLGAKEQGIVGILTADLDKGKHEPYLYIENPRGLASLVQRSSLELHVWGCQIDKPEKPDWMIFDLDPAPDVSWSTVVEAAFHVKDELADYGLESFVKTTGGKGLHLTVPLKRIHSWDTMFEFSKLFSQYLAEKYPKAYVATMSKAKRKGKIFIDYLRNHRGATAIAPYSTRARLHCPVATPISWEELTPKLDPLSFTLLTVPQRLAKLKGDPWGGFFKVAQKLPEL